MISQGDLKEWYDREYSLSPRRFTRDLKHYEHFIKHLKPEQGKSILDVACGTGGLLMLAERSGLKISGIDLSQKAVELAKARLPGADIRVANGESLPFNDGDFDYVTNIGSLEHYLNKKKGISEMIRVLKKGGKIMVVLPNSFWELHKGTGQKLEDLNTYKGWRKFLEDNGLKIKGVFKDSGPSVFHDIKLHKIVLRALGKLMTMIMLVQFAYQFVFVCEPEKENPVA